jgi:hypothetical protein
MKKICKPGCAHKLIGANIALGILVFIVAVYFIISGEYANLETRKSTETLLNAAAIGGLIYSVAAWYLDLLIHPQFSKTDS